MSFLNTLLEQVFGIELNRKPVEKIETPIFVDTPDGSYIVPAGGERSVLYYDYSVTTDGMNEVQLINTYRELSKDPEVAKAIDEISSEAIASSENYVVTIDFDNIDGFPDKTKERIVKEFEKIQKLMGFKDFPSVHFERFYIDGRIYYHILTSNKTTDGIKKIILIDPRTLKPIKEKDLNSNSKNLYDISKDKKFYVYTQQELVNDYTVNQYLINKVSSEEIILTDDSIAYANSGYYGDTNVPLSYLHNAIRPANQLRMIEDSLVIYRWARAPEKRIFRIDVSGMPRHKQDQYLRETINKFKNNSSYDSTTGKIKDSRRQISMLEDFYFPKTEGNNGTEVETLAGGQMISGDLPDLSYFRKKLLTALKVPLSRFNEDGSSTVFSRSSEISRDEINFQKFVAKLQKQFSFVFLKLLEVQLRLKKIINEKEWDVLRENINFVWEQDNLYSELKESELMSNRLGLLGQVEPYISKYFSNRQVMKKILRMTDDEIITISKEINQERKEMGKDVENADVSRTVQTNPTAIVPGAEPLIFKNIIGSDDPEAEKESPVEDREKRINPEK
nr:MAG TPA: capsid assembly protein [Caudoviricetes sp.]